MEDAHSNWPDEVFAALRAAELRQIAYVPDAGHATLIRRAQAEPSMRAIALTTEEEGIALLAHPAVLEAAAVGVPDPSYGQDILAAVVLKPGAACSEAELRAFCLAELGRYKTPREFRFLAELPKGPSGKVQRLSLLDAGGG